MEPKLLTHERFVDKDTECSYRFVLSTTEYFRPHYHDYYELFVILEGTTIQYINGTRHKQHRGDMVFIRPSDVHDYICENGQEFSMMNITFTAKTANELFCFLGEGFPSNILKSLPMPPIVHLSENNLNWFNSQMDSICAIGGNSKEELKTSLRILLFKVFTKFFSDTCKNDESMPLWLDSLLDKMQLNSNYIYGVDRLLELSGKSREHTLRSIKKHTGMTATEFINGLRLNYIANMLHNSNHSVSYIIFESGFNNISWASTLFRRKFGMTMQEFRKNG